MNMLMFLLLFVSSGVALVELEADASHVSAGWTKLGEARGTVALTFPLRFREGGVEMLKTEVYERADPKSPLFRQWLSREKIDEYLRPEPASVEAVSRWLGNAGALSLEVTAGRYINARFTVTQAEQLLHTKFFDFERDGVTLRRSDQAYFVPENIRQHIDFVGGVRHFPDYMGKVRVQKKHANNKKRSLFVTPNLIKKTYGIGDYESPDDTSNQQAVAQFLGQHYHQSDLDIFFTFYSSDQKSALRHPKVVGPDSGFAGVEASLDIEYQMGVSTNTPTQFWSTAGTSPKGDGGQEPFLAFMQNIAKLSDLDVPKIISVSYGDDEPTISVAYQKRCDAEFVAAGGRGITLFFASGDSGVSGGGGCPNNVFVPSFPDSSPHVVSVGGTLHNTRGQAWSGSGGGFSNVFARPAYQDAAVEKFLSSSTDLPPASKYNTSNSRAYPDISAYSTGFLVITNLLPSPVDGTSCASPTASAVFSLLNSVLLQKKNTTLGFLNPWLYSLKSGFSAITSGCNPGCNSNGFCASKNSEWSPVAGKGEPIFQQLRDLL